MKDCLVLVITVFRNHLKIAPAVALNDLFFVDNAKSLRKVAYGLTRDLD